MCVFVFEPIGMNTHTHTHAFSHTHVKLSLLRRINCGGQRVEKCLKTAPAKKIDRDSLKSHRTVTTNLQLNILGGRPRTDTLSRLFATFQSERLPTLLRLTDPDNSSFF